MPVRWSQTTGTAGHGVQRLLASEALVAPAERMELAAAPAARRQGGLLCRGWLSVAVEMMLCNSVALISGVSALDTCAPRGQRVRDGRAPDARGRGPCASCGRHAAGIVYSLHHGLLQRRHSQ